MALLYYQHSFGQTRGERILGLSSSDVQSIDCLGNCYLLRVDSQLEERYTRETMDVSRTPWNEHRLRVHKRPPRYLLVSHSHHFACCGFWNWLAWGLWTPWCMQESGVLLLRRNTSRAALVLSRIPLALFSDTTGGAYIRFMFMP